MDKRFLFVLFFLLLSIGLVSAKQITQVGDFTSGLTLKYPADDTLKFRQSYEFDIHVYNTSNGVARTSGISCYFHLYNSSGGHILELYDNSVSTTFDYSFFVDGGNFSTIGAYSYLVSCNSSIEGGFVDVALEVNPSGVEATGSNVVFFVIVIVLIYFLAFFGLSTKNVPITIIGGMAMLFLGIYMFNNGIIIFRDDLTRYLSYVTIGIGAILAIWASYDWYQDM